MKEELVYKILLAKKASGKTFTQIAKEVGLTNLYTAQLLPDGVEAGHGTSPAICSAGSALNRLSPASRTPDSSDELIEEMKVSSLRQFDPTIIQDPTVYRLYEAIMLYGESIKAIANEEFGDGIMSAVDMFASADDIVGAFGERRMVIALNGKFLPHVEQKTANNTALPPKAK